MTRKLISVARTNRGKILAAEEPLLFHCNHYNYWLQKTLLLVPGIGMEEVLVDAATEVSYAFLAAGASEKGCKTS